MLRSHLIEVAVDSCRFGLDVWIADSSPGCPTSRQNKGTPAKISLDEGSNLNHLAEEVGFEPTVPCGTTVFKTAAFNHSAIPPYTVQRIPGIVVDPAT